MTFLKALCLFTCLWWCWLNISHTVTCYQVCGDMLFCMSRLEDDLKAPAIEARRVSREYGH